MRIRVWNVLTIAPVAFVIVSISLWMGKQAYSWFPVEAAFESHLVDELFSFLVVLGTLIFLGVTSTVLYSILFHRAAKDDMSDGPPIEGNLTLEVIWTAIPVLLVFWIAGYSYQIYNQMGIQGPMEAAHLHMMESAEAAPMETGDAKPIESIDVVAKQWAWIFHYPNNDVTSTELHLPVNQRVRLALQSEDVLHGFYVPEFRVKQDIVPKQIINLEFTPILEGKYQLTDSQFSGTYFAANEASVVVESEDDYNNWLNTAASQTPSPAKNQAADEYKEASESSFKNGWETVIPAAPPVVNYPG
ncbi:MAG: cytochrome c oxidase subunit II [Scytonematopsis contorta HA4267-MV1]|jgi:cytochrome c oxidase subunit 2|nr:cytochrome c oxidase subunit II [Scytonematopsis contorta HA4267-MV1]